MTKNSDRVVDRVMRGLRGGDVILLHDRLENSEELLEKLLTALRTQHYTTATVDELFKIEAYEK